MITEKDLQEAIAECQGQRNPTANTCIKLAAFYTIRNELFGAKPEPVRYSFASGNQTISFDSGSEFSQAVKGKDPDEVFKVLDELMEAVQATNPKLYASVMRRLR